MPTTDLTSSTDSNLSNVTMDVQQGVTFASLNLSAPVLRAVQEMGYTEPSPIQAQALPILLAGPTDFLGLAGTGTGKTAAFAIPLLERIDGKKRTVQALILCPTRELALQVAGQIDLLGKYKGVRSISVYGGAPFGDQVRGLKAGAQIVVGTPGRVIDHLERKTLILSDVATLILDEADEMFSMGFKDELDTILASVNQEQSNTWLFSATMSREVRRTVETNLRSPKTVQVNRTAVLASGVEQYYYRCQENEKADMICKLIEAADDFYGIIFCQTKALVADLTRYLLDRGYKADSLHGDMDQTSRERTMQAFRDRKLTVVVCTDVAARGLDVKDITHVVNYSLPREMESYVHRIGRTARSGKTGIVMNMLTFSHRHLLGRIEAHTKVRMVEGFVPTKREIATRKIGRLLPTFLDQPFAERALEVMNDEFKAQLATMTPEDVAANFIVMMMPDIFGGEDSRKTKKAARPATVSASVAAPVATRAVAAPVARPVATPVAAPVAAKPVVAKPAAPKPKPTPAEPARETPEPIAPIMTASSADESDDISDDISDVSDDEMMTETVDASADDSTPELNASSEVSTDIDMFGDEVTAPQAKTISSLDLPPRLSKASKRELFTDDEIESMLDEPTPFGVVKSTPDATREEKVRFTRDEALARHDHRPRRDSFAPRREGYAPRRDSSASRPGGGFASRGDNGFGPRTTGTYNTASSRPQAAGFSGWGAGAAGARGPRTGGPSAPRSTNQFRSRPEGATGGSSRPEGSGFSRPSAASAPATSRPMASRPEAPMNLGKAPKHDPGPARTARQGETGGLNRRARRAALYGRELGSATPGATDSSN